MPPCTILHSYDVKEAPGRLLVTVVFPDSATDDMFHRLTSVLASALPASSVAIVNSLDVSWFQYSGQFAITKVSVADILCVRSLLALMYDHLTIFDSLDESHALAPYQLYTASDPEGNKSREMTEIGEIVNKAKYQPDAGARGRLQALLLDFIREHPSYRNADVLCAVPSSSAANGFHLPTYLGKNLGSALGKAFVPVDKVRETQPQKDIEDEAAKRMNVQHSMAVSTCLNAKTVVALDDFYESGSSMEELARACRAAGAMRILGLAATKNRKGLKVLAAEDYADRWIVR